MRDTSDSAAILDLKGLRKNYGALQVLDDLDFSVARGAVFGIIGPNGAGKTTLFNVIAGVVRPSVGTISFEGRDVTKLSVWDRCRGGIGRTYQVPKPFSNMSVYENVLAAALHGGRLSMRDASARVRLVLDQVHMAHRAETRAGDLTLLDLKRLELAKALGSNPKLLLLDEIAGGLMDAECDTLLEIVAELRAEGVTIVWIEHVIHALRRIADTIAVLYQGKFIATGPPDEVLSSPAVREIYVGGGE